MIKKLRRKFIAVCMCAVFLVLLVIISTINIINYNNVNKTADRLLTLLEDNQGVMPDGTQDTGVPDTPLENPEENPGSTPLENPNDTPDALPSDGSNDNPDPASQPEPSDKPEGKDTNPAEQPTQDFNNWDFSFRPQDLSPETPFSTRYFTVTLADTSTASQPEVIATDTGKIAAVTSDTAASYATTLYQAGKKEGFLSNYKYRQIQTDGGYMYIFLDCEKELTTFHSFLYASILISVLGLIFILILVILFSKIAVAPVAEGYEKQKCFITDASHELKTPLAIIDANTEVIELEQGESKWTRSTRNQIKRLTSLTEKLVFLSRMEEEQSQLNKIDFSLSDTVREVTDSFEAVAEAKGKHLTVSIENELHFHGDASSIRQLVSLLLDNAVKYSSDGGAITVTLRSQGKTKELVVENTVTDIRPGRHEELFERFYRPDKSRSKETGGFGIGLSVAKAIVEAHKGKITANSPDGSTLAFTILL
jgi:K+-sensing histidine kinase KdpD